MAYPLRWPGGRDACAADALPTVKSLIHTQVGEDNVAAVIIEPIQGEGGFVVPPDGFLPGLAEFCAEYGIVFIADEIQTGFCRTGDWFACDHEGVVPDLITTAKGIAGGLPLAGVTGRAETMDSVHAGGLGGTYGGNPGACAAALGAIETMAAEDLPARARRIGDVMLPRLHKLAETYPVIADVRGRGAMLAIELTRLGTLDPDPATTSAVAKACHQAGLVTLTCGTFGNVLRFLPPLVIGEDLLDEGLSILEDAFAAACEAIPARECRPSGPTRAAGAGDGVSNRNGFFAQREHAQEALRAMPINHEAPIHRNKRDPPPGCLSPPMESTGRPRVSGYPYPAGEAILNLRTEGRTIGSPPYQREARGMGAGPGRAPGNRRSEEAQDVASNAPPNQSRLRRRRPVRVGAAAFR